MPEDKTKFSSVVQCGHCRNSAPMAIVAEHSQVSASHDDQYQMEWDEGWWYEMLECPACRELTFRRLYFHEHDYPPDADWQILYPVETKPLIGLPASLSKAYAAAQRVRNVDSNSYGVLIGRLLETICEELGAKGDRLHERLLDLAGREEFPRRLADAAMGLKHFRNIGAHASIGELTAAEVPILDDLIRAVLEYLYVLPAVIQKAEVQIVGLKSKSKKKRANKKASTSRKKKTK